MHNVSNISAKNRRIRRQKRKNRSKLWSVKKKQILQIKTPRIIYHIYLSIQKNKEPSSRASDEFRWKLYESISTRRYNRKVPPKTPEKSSKNGTETMICWCHFSVTFFCLSATYRGPSNLLELRVVMKRNSEIISRNNAPRKRNDDNSTIHGQDNLQANSTMKDGIVTIHSPVEIATNR